MNQDQQRADFEAWYFREFEVYPRRNESGGFKSQYVNAMFKSWKAGQAALQSQDREDDPLQPAVNWLNATIIDLTAIDIQRRLFVGHNRAQRMLDHARSIGGES